MVKLPIPSLLFRLGLLLGLVSSGAFAAPADHTLDLDTVSEAAEPGVSGVEPATHVGGLSWKEYFGQHPSLKNLELGIKMGGSAPLSKQESTPMIPASVEKIFTASAALRHLGSTLRFENSFSGRVNSISGVLLKPHFRVSGDPTWGSEYYEGVLNGTHAQHNESITSRLQPVIRTLIALGVRRVQGPIEMESLRPRLASEGRPGDWKPEWNLQCMAQLQTEFVANGNCGVFKIHSPSKYGWITSGVTVPVEVKATRTRSGASKLKVVPVFDDLGRILSYSITGTLSQVPIEYALPVHQGVDWLRNLFIEELKKASIEYDESGVESWFQLAVSSPIDLDLSSRPLVDVLRTAVQYSINGVMDRVFLEIGYALGRPAEAVLKEHVQAMVRDPALLQGIEMNDGSGLSTGDRMRPDTVHAFLVALRDQPWFHDFFSTLAVAGKSGTLQHRATLANSIYTNGKIYGKTGTLGGIINLAGYFASSESAVPEPFVILTRSSLSADAVRPMVDGIVVNFAARNTQRK